MNDAYNYSIELGMTEKEALALASCNDGVGASRDNILRIARRKGLPCTKPDYPTGAGDVYAQLVDKATEEVAKAMGIFEPSPDVLGDTPRPLKSPASGKLPVKRKRATRRKAKG